MSNFHKSGGKTTAEHLSNLATLTAADSTLADGYAKVLLTSAGGTAVKADSTCVIQQDEEHRRGWQCKNTVAGTKFNLYYFDGSQEIITLGQIKSIYFKGFVNKFSETLSMPYLHIYTKPTGSGDAGAFYHSRLTFSYGDDDTIGIGEECVFHGKEEPETKFNNRHVKLTVESVDGEGSDSEEILYMTVSSDTGATTGEVDSTINLVGFNTFLNPNIKRNLELYSGEFSAGSVSVDGITVGSDDSLAECQQVLSYGRKDASPSGLRAIKCTDDGTLHNYDTGLNMKITAGSDATIAQAAQFLAYGRDQSGGVDALNVDNNGHLKITLNDIEPDIAASIQVKQYDSEADIGNETIAGLASQTATGTLISTIGYSRLGIVGTTTNTSDPVILQVQAGGVWRDFKTDYGGAVPGTFGFDEVPSFRNYRVKQTDTVGANFTVDYSYARR